MNLTWTKEERDFQEEVRAFIAKNLPDDIRQKAFHHQRIERDDYIRWHAILTEHG